uniref:Uncharacterized protein n=1 Tax=Oryza officinalis TaxID=4535 RepID=A0A1V1H7R3_9ORYZ|nr:hypothetical protein [Oryza officinalis]
MAEIEAGCRTCPVTGERLSTADVVPNAAPLPRLRRSLAAAPRPRLRRSPTSPLARRRSGPRRPARGKEREGGGRRNRREGREREIREREGPTVGPIIFILCE